MTFTDFECDQTCYASGESVSYSDSDAGKRMTLSKLPMFFLKATPTIVSEAAAAPRERRRSRRRDWADDGYRAELLMRTEEPG